MNSSTNAAQSLFGFYKRAISPAFHALPIGGGCRFQPTCSEYAALAFAEHGWYRGALLSLGRLLRCHPGCNGGFDPVPGTWPACSPAPIVQSSSVAITIEEPHISAVQPASHDCRT